MNIRSPVGWCRILQLLYGPNHSQPHHLPIKVTLLKTVIGLHGRKDWGFVSVLFYEFAGAAVYVEFRSHFSRFPLRHSQGKINSVPQIPALFFLANAS